MKRLGHLLRRMKYVFAFLLATITTVACVYGIKAKAQTYYEADGHTFTNQLNEGALPSNGGDYYLAKDLYLTCDYNLSVGADLRIYLNGHNIYLNEHQIFINSGTVSIHDTLYPYNHID